MDFAALGDDVSARVMRKCFADGLIVERVGRKNSVVKLMPPLVIDEEELLEGLKILKNAIVACI